MKKKYLYAFLIVSIIYSMFLNKNILAASGNPMLHSYDIKIFSENQNFNMPKSAAAYYLEMPKGTTLNNDCYLNIHYSASNTLIDNLSSMSVSVNGVNIATDWIFNIKKISSSNWKVNIPIDKLKVGQKNEIRIESDHRSIVGDCADIDNPSNWVTIYKDSELHISDVSVYSPLLSDFYSSYFDCFSDKQHLTANFVLSQNQNSNLISSLLKLNSAIGGLYADRNLIKYSVTQGESSKIVNENSILITSENKLGKNQGSLSISDRTQENENYKTIISGENQDGINKAINFITDNTLLKQIKDKTLNIASIVSSKYNKFTQNKKGLYKFSNWGYSDVKLAGAFHQKTSFSFVQPNDVQALGGSYIKLNFKHSKILLSDRSLMTVYVDGKVVNNTKLSDSNAEDGSLRVRIPDSALKKTVIKVDIEVYNYIGKIDCSKDYYDSAWTYIDSDSEVCLIPGTVGIQPSLDSFPFFNTYNENKESEILVDFSNSISNNELTTASVIAARAGQNAKEQFNFEIVKENDNFTKKQKNEDMIFIGSFNNINLPDKVKTALSIAPLANNKFKIQNGLQVLPETLKGKTVVQVIRSPWNFYKRIYVITYDSDSDIKKFSDILSNTEYLKKLEGQISIIDREGGITNLQVSDSNDNKVPLTLSSVVHAVEDKSGFSWWVILVAVILIIMCIYAVIKLRKKTNEFEEAGDKMKKAEGFKKEDNDEK